MNEFVGRAVELKLTGKKAKCPYCGRNMKISKPPSPGMAPLFSQFQDCKGGLFGRHDLIQWCSADNTFQTKNGKIARELAKKGYKVRNKGDSYEIFKGEKGLILTLKPKPIARALR